MKKVILLFILALFSVLLIGCSSNSLKDYNKSEAENLGIKVFERQLDKGISTKYLEIYNDEVRDEIYNLELYKNEKIGLYYAKDIQNRERFEYDIKENKQIFIKDDKPVLGFESYISEEDFLIKYFGFQDLEFDFKKLRDYNYEIVETYTPLNSGPFYGIQHYFRFKTDFELKFIFLNKKYTINNVKLEFYSDRKEIKALSIIIIGDTIINDKERKIKLVLNNRDFNTTIE